MVPMYNVMNDQKISTSFVTENIVDSITEFTIYYRIFKWAGFDC